MLPDVGDTVAMMHVFVLPPSDSCKLRISVCVCVCMCVCVCLCVCVCVCVHTCRRRVSLDSRYGTWGWCSTSAVITRPNVSSDWLICPASFFLMYI